MVQAADAGRAEPAGAASVVEEIPADHPALPLMRYQLHFRARDAMDLPPFWGSALRGAFGHALKRTVCAMGMRACEGCYLRQSCVFPYFFETEPGADASRMRRYTQAPHPFVIHPPSPPAPAVEAGGTFRFDMTLVGEANRFVAHVVRAVERAGAFGLGPNRSRCELVEVTGQSALGDLTCVYAGGDALTPVTTEPVQAAEPAPERVRLHLRTPLRLKQDNKLMGPEGFTPGPFLMNVVRRVSMLRTFHTPQPLDAAFRDLKAQSRACVLREHRLVWHDLGRWSSRQEQHLRMGGLRGWLELDLAGARDLWPYLWLGQHIHAGKGATLGLGSYFVEVV